jgi:KaiC/GvpD/RAD55 family RecA-like ATPase
MAESFPDATAQSDRSPASTGDTVLDRMLRGGVPRNRPILVSGGPGAGKSTLGMQFLQAGLAADEDVLYVSTEQTLDELHDSFRSFAFDLDADGLHVTSVHATPGHLFDDEEQLTLGTVGDDETSVGAFGADVPFEMEYIRDHLSEYDHCDRVVFDSVSGLAPLADDTPRFRRGLLELVRTFSEEFGAASLFVAEESDAHEDVPAAELLQFTTHGAVRLVRERVAGEYHRFLEVTKLRGVDHDTAPHEFEITDGGIEVFARGDRQAKPDADAVSTGIAGLDRLTGGGYPEGNSTVIENDGRADVSATIAGGLLGALEADRSVALFPEPNMTPGWLREKVCPYVAPLGELLDDDRLFVVDWSNAWDVDHRNVFPVHLSGLWDLLTQSKFYLTQKLLRIYRTLTDRRTQPLTAFVYTETMLQDLGPSDVRFQYNWARANILTAEDNVVFVQNPVSMGEQLAEFYVHDAQQVIRQWVHDNGMEYVRLNKSAGGQTGVSRHVSHLDEPPYLEVRASGGDSIE